MEEKEKKVKKPFYKRPWFIGLIILMAIGAIFGEKETSKDGKKIEEEKLVVEKDEKSSSKNNNITGSANIYFKDGKAIFNIESNAADGTIFEISLIDGNFSTLSEFITIENGKASKEFDIPEDWEVGYIAPIAMIRFNLEDHPQPDHIKEIYGENGEKLSGDLAIENNLGGKNINLEIAPVAYPDEQTVKETQSALFLDALDELITSSNGVILGVQPYLEKDNWSSVAVTVSDAWYNSAEHEKERFAEQVGELVSGLIINSGKVESNVSPRVYLFDAYQKELATPKIAGGYKIKR